MNFEYWLLLREKKVQSLPLKKLIVLTFNKLLVKTIS